MTTNAGLRGAQEPRTGGGGSEGQGDGAAGPVECNGICVMGWEVLEGYSGDAVAHAHPDCEKHGRWAR